jgi:hypothetical protein
MIKPKLILGSIVILIVVIFFSVWMYRKINDWELQRMAKKYGDCFCEYYRKGIIPNNYNVDSQLFFKSKPWLKKFYEFSDTNYSGKSEFSKIYYSYDHYKLLEENKCVKIYKKEHEKAKQRIENTNFLKKLINLKSTLSYQNLKAGAIDSLQNPEFYNTKGKYQIIGFEDIGDGQFKVFFKNIVTLQIDTTFMDSYSNDKYFKYYYPR